MMLFFMILIGVSVGSFLNVLIHRLPNKQSIIFPSSYCPHCKEKIPWYYNIPIVSFLILKGLSNCCNKSISIRYLFVEIISMVLWIWTYYYIPNIDDKILFLIFSSSLLVIMITDYNHFYIPFELNILMFISALTFFIYNDHNLWNHFLPMLLLLSYFIVLTLLTTIVLKRDSMGYGDIILIGIIGFWLGLFLTLIIIVFASLLSLIHWLFLKAIKKEESIVLPFGSTLAMSAILVDMTAKILQFDTSFLLIW